MKISHIAIYTKDLEAMKLFYTRYFNGVSNAKYVNPVKRFESYFISFGTGAKLEIMSKASIVKPAETEECLGITHIALKLESTKAVVDLTERLRKDGFIISEEPRTTGDGFFESLVLDPEGNRVEITA
jgi:catechol 2,3-dioxygenase-like lactoylglutathione lyase family enzyme